MGPAPDRKADPWLVDARGSAGSATIAVTLHGGEVSVAAEVFSALFDNSVVASKAPIRHAREKGRISFRTLLALSREAEIPYPLFFAPPAVVHEQIRIKTNKLMSGFTERDFSMNSRNQVLISDIELIVKDLLRKQQHLRTDPTLVKNPVIGCIKRPGPSPQADAARLMSVLEIGPRDLVNARNKSSALRLLIDRLEAKQVLVARSAKDHMPQRIPRRAKFSGITVKDPKVPYIFLASGDEGEHLEPAGRKVFTLTLLAVLIGSGTFAPVTYDGHTTDETSFREYEITAEILMPAADMRRSDLGSLDAVKTVADLNKVTPSAVAMRLRRLGLIDLGTFRSYMDQLAAEYAARESPPMRSPHAVNALRRYNGNECSRRMLAQLDSGQINAKDFCRVMFSNKLRPHQINEFRAAVR